MNAHFLFVVTVLFRALFWIVFPPLSVIGVHPFLVFHCPSLTSCAMLLFVCGDIFTLPLKNALLVSLVVFLLAGKNHGFVFFVVLFGSHAKSIYQAREKYYMASVIGTGVATPPAQLVNTVQAIVQKYVAPVK